MTLVVESMGTHSECSCENPLCTRTEFGILEKREESRDSSAKSESVKIERLLAPFGCQRLGCQPNDFDLPTSVSNRSARAPQ